MHQRKKEVNDFLEYKKDIQFDACYQKIGNVDMDYPYILFKNICATTNKEDEIKEVQEYFINKSQFDKEIENLVNGKFVAEIKIGENYYDSKNKKCLIHNEYPRCKLYPLIKTKKPKEGYTLFSICSLHKLKENQEPLKSLIELCRKYGFKLTKEKNISSIISSQIL